MIWFKSYPRCKGDMADNRDLHGPYSECLQCDYKGIIMPTKIEWTHIPGYIGETWNPVTGCVKISPGCANCYAETMLMRF